MEEFIGVELDNPAEIGVIAEDIRLWRDPVLGVAGTELLTAHFVRRRYHSQIRDEAVVAAITDGRLRFRVGAEEGTAVAGNVLVVPAGETFAAEPASESGWSCRAFYPDINTLTAMASEPSAAPPRGADRELGPLYGDPAFAQHLTSLHRAVEMNDANALARQQAFSAAMAAVLQHCAGPAGWPRRIRPENKAVLGAIECVRAHFSNPRLSIEDLAAVAGYSPYHFMRTFRAALGMTAHDYLIQCRLHAARRMLAEGVRAAEAAVAAGFADQSHLIRQFRSMLGITPGKYAEQCRKRMMSRAQEPGVRLLGDIPERRP